MVKKLQGVKPNKHDFEQYESNDEEDGGLFGSDHDDFYAPELDEFGLEADDSDDAPETLVKSKEQKKHER